LLVDGAGVDVETASEGRFTADRQAVFARWAEFRSWAGTMRAESTSPVSDADLGAPVPRPTQVFAIGMNYRDHAAEAGLDIPDRPAAFTKFQTCLAGPFAEVALPTPCVD